MKWLLVILSVLAVERVRSLPSWFSNIDLDDSNEVRTRTKGSNWIPIFRHANRFEEPVNKVIKHPHFTEKRYRRSLLWSDNYTIFDKYKEISQGVFHIDDIYKRIMDRIHDLMTNVSQASLLRDIRERITALKNKYTKTTENVYVLITLLKDIIDSLRWSYNTRKTPHIVNDEEHVTSTTEEVTTEYLPDLVNDKKRENDHVEESAEEYEKEYEKDSVEKSVKAENKELLVVPDNYEEYRVGQ